MTTEVLIPTTLTGLPILGRSMVDALRAVVEPMLYGGRLEHVSVLHEGRPTDMFVGEDSAYAGNVRNDKATKIYRANWMDQHPTTDPESLPAIYGPAVLVDRRVWF